MSEWRWFQDFHYEATRSGDQERRKLLLLHDQAFSCRETDPDRTLALFAEGRALAEALGEPWWVMLFDHWQVHGTIYYKGDFRTLLDPAIRNVVKVRKPACAGFPQRLRVYNDLVTIYLRIDPRGYEDEIRSALDEMGGELTPEMDSSHYLWLESRIAFALSLDQTDEAHTLTMAALGRSDAEPNRHTADHHRVALHAFLCAIAYRRRAWDDLLSWALLAEESGRKMSYLYPVARAQMWQALAHRKAGDVLKAGRLYGAAERRREGLTWPPCGGYYDALCHYQRLAGEPRKALEGRQRQFADIRDKGTLAYECFVLTEQCRLRRELGELGEGHLEEARAAARRLRKPAVYLEGIDKVASGEDRAEL